MNGAQYRPAPEVLKLLAGVDLVAVVGPAAVGKTTLIRAAVRCESRMRPVLNNTSREPRPDERDGVDFRFETRVRMRERMALREYVQVAPNVFGPLYATAAEDYSTSGVALLPVLADAVPQFRALPFGSLRVVYVLPPDVTIWHRRLAHRGWDEETLAKRVAEGQRSLRFAMADAETQFVVNDDLTTGVGDFITIALRQPWTARLRHDQIRARGMIEEMLRASLPVLERSPGAAYEK